MTDRDRAWTSELSILLKLGLPMAMTQLIQFSVQTIDIVMIGRLGAEPLAASSLGQVFYHIMWLTALGPAMAVAPMVSQSLGANTDNREDVRLSVRMGLWVVFMTFPIAVAILSFTEEIALVLRQPAVVAEGAAPYVLALTPGLPFALGVLILRNFLAAIERTQAPLLIVVMTTALNAFLNYLLIYGSWGAPELGLIGAGIASSLAHAIGFFALVLYIGREKVARQFDLFADFLQVDRARLSEVIRLGWPIGVTTGFEFLLFGAAVFLMGLIGVAEMAAYQVVLNVAAIAFMIPLGLSLAGCVRIGLAAGAGDRARARNIAVLTVIISAVGIMIVAVPMVAMPESIAALYLNTVEPGNRPVAALIIAFLPIAGAFALFDATQVAANQCLRGLKDVRRPMVLTAISYWAIGFPFAAGLGLGTPLGAVGVWWGLLAGLASAAVLLGWRLWTITSLPKRAVLISSR